MELSTSLKKFMFEFFVEKSVSLLLALGYWGVFFLMALESTVFPIPSEAVMPFAGFLIGQGKFSWWWVFFSSTLGSLTGSMVSYWFGRRFGRDWVLNFGKYLLLNEEHLEMAEKFFAKHGQKTVFLSRFVPIVRHFISLPAGMCQMPMNKFMLYTFLGASIWNMFLAATGYLLQDNWAEIKSYTHWADYLIAIGIVFVIACWIWKAYRRKDV